MDNGTRGTPCTHAYDNTHTNTIIYTYTVLYYTLLQVVKKSLEYNKNYIKY